MKTAIMTLEIAEQCLHCARRARRLVYDIDPECRARKRRRLRKHGVGEQVALSGGDGRAGLLGLGSKKAGPLHDFAYVAIAFLLAGALGRYRRTFGRRLGIGLRSELVQTFLDRGQTGLQTSKCGKNRIRDTIDLVAQGLEFGSSQIAAFEAFFYLRQSNRRDLRRRWTWAARRRARFTTSLMSLWLFCWLARSAATAELSGGALESGFGPSLSKRSLIAARRGSRR
jgi:hypothetical protein